MVTLSSQPGPLMGVVDAFNGFFMTPIRAYCLGGISLLACLLSSLTPLPAQPLTMEGAVEASLSQYPTLAAQRSALNALRSGTEVLRANRLPNLRLHSQTNVGTANGLSGSYFSLGLIVPTSGARRDNNSGNLATGNIALASADWEFYNFGRFGAEDQLLRADVAVGEARLTGSNLTCGKPS